MALRFSAGGLRVRGMARECSLAGIVSSQGIGGGIPCARSLERTWRGSLNQRMVVRRRGGIMSTWRKLLSFDCDNQWVRDLRDHGSGLTDICTLPLVDHHTPACQDLFHLSRDTPAFPTPNTLVPIRRTSTLSRRFCTPRPEPRTRNGSFRLSRAVSPFWIIVFPSVLCSLSISLPYVPVPGAPGSRDCNGPRLCRCTAGNQDAARAVAISVATKTGKRAHPSIKRLIQDAAEESENPPRCRDLFSTNVVRSEHDSGYLEVDVFSVGIIASPNPSQTDLSRHHRTPVPSTGKAPSSVLQGI
jgi:hypothetical protein